VGVSGVFITGLGVVSPAGWGLQAFDAALTEHQALPVQELDRPGWSKSLRFLPVPAPVPRPACFAHPRLRRVSPITHYATAAAMEALGEQHNSSVSLGLVVCLASGCVQYSQRFFAEVLADPATASPLLFPETVFAAPASHVASVAPNVTSVSTLMGDPGAFLQGVALAADWLLEGVVDKCLVVGAEEINWLLADALWTFDHEAVLSGGAGALCLSTKPANGRSVELDCITTPVNYSVRGSRRSCLAQVRSQLPAPYPGELLCDGLPANARNVLPEAAVFADWPGSRLSVKRLFGEGLMAAAAWQCVAAANAVARHQVSSAVAILAAGNQQAIASRFIARNEPSAV
jgi:hypothetical protein